MRELAFLFGAAKQIRTADLVITNDVLYHLSYSSIFYAADFHLRHNLATVKGLEPSTSSVTGWRTNRLYYTATFRFAPLGEALDYNSTSVSVCQYFFERIFIFHLMQLLCAVHLLVGRGLAPAEPHQWNCQSEIKSGGSKPPPYNESIDWNSIDLIPLLVPAYQIRVC